MTNNTKLKILRYKDLKELFNIYRSSLHRWETSGVFPTRVHLGQNSIGWKEEEIINWINQRTMEKT